MDVDDFCIICLENILFKDAIWSCSTCYCEYHLVCINNWISQYRNCKQKLLTEEQDSLNLSEGYSNAITRLSKLKSDINKWSCPKCRNEYDYSEAPNKYLCYCGKVNNPETNHWLKPHTCGEKCGKFLKPYCGDICLELCHQGPCQPCPKLLNNVPCYCEKDIKTAIRCSQRFWSCGRSCDKLLTCGIHRCDQLCHKSCDKCHEIVEKACLCESQTKRVQCSETWQCSKSCQPIDLSRLNKCPCGKTSLDTLITSDGYQQTTCCDTCSKLLECGTHRCADKCHLGDCSNCRQVVSKSCRCGATNALIPCHKKLTCNTKCVRLKNCNNHQCKRRCCDPNGECAPCELICNNLLSCRKHRCQMRCHVGPCYPCQKTVDVSCPCGESQKHVTCGANIDRIRERLTRYCDKECQQPTRCRHENRHKCHSALVPCPPCRVSCSSVLDCGHQCHRTCHDSVKTTIHLDKSKLAGPWEIKDDGKIVFVKQPCPPCDAEMTLTCLGAHETISYICSQPIKYASCGKPCGRVLACGNHQCSLECHQVSDELRPKQLLGDLVQVTAASRYCEDSCNKLCTKSLQQNRCEHPCSLISCHPGPCPPCTRYVSYKCHCGSLDLHIKCCLGPSPPEEMLSCPARCARLLSKTCGHQCPRNCHPGECQDVNIQCKTKVTKWCPCGQKKMTVPCWKTENFHLECDPIKCDTTRDSTDAVRKRKALSNGNSNTGTDSSISKGGARVSRFALLAVLTISISVAVIVVLVWLTRD